MALRIRTDGRVLCAAMHKGKKGDFYINDGLHYHLSQIAKVLWTDPMPKHSEHGEWWWINSNNKK